MFRATREGVDGSDDYEEKIQLPGSIVKQVARPKSRDQSKISL